MELLKELFQGYFNSNPDSIVPLVQSGSNRAYFRLRNAEGDWAIGVYNENLKENTAFTYLAEHFHKKGIEVPKLYNHNLTEHVYLQEDLGDSSLYGKVKASKEAFLTPELVEDYQKAVQALLKMQIAGHEGLDYSIAYPVPAFDKQAMIWDLNYFKYCFLKLTHISFDESELEKDFFILANYLSNTPSDYFMHRDFQSRNLQLKEDSVFIIDFQGGRKGPLQYDLVSLLFQASVKMPNEVREELLDYYIEELSSQLAVDIEVFKAQYYAFVYLRTMQVFGAYGYRGLYEKKAYFKNSIPLAAKNLKWLLENQSLPLQLPELEKVWQNIVEKFCVESEKETAETLIVTVSSFSYLKGGIPEDDSGNGGGFVFDCRSILNPGRVQSMKRQTGRDQAVMDYLENQSQIHLFLNPIYEIVDKAVENYLERGFKNLMVSFGCTGGQHRSVYSADNIAAHLKEKYDLEIVLKHIEQEKKNWVN